MEIKERLLNINNVNQCDLDHTLIINNCLNTCKAGNNSYIEMHVVDVFVGASIMIDPETMTISCAELREMVEENPDEMEVVVEMMLDADEEICIAD